MNLLFRLLHLLFAHRFRPAAGPLDEVVTPFRVWPTDLDLNRHMNNGKYLSVMDVARVDLMLRSKLIGTLKRARTYPLVASQSIRYRRALHLFGRFEVRTRVLGWDDRFVYLQQSFVARGELAASAVVKAIFLHAERGRVEPAELFGLAGIQGDELELPGWVTDWVASEDAAWEAAGGLS